MNYVNDKETKDIEAGNITRIFGSNLRELRESLHITQQHLAEEIDSYRSTISDIELGISNTKLTTIWRIIHTIPHIPGVSLSEDDVAKRLFKRGNV